jgi:putative acetyltransferase
MNQAHNIRRATPADLEKILLLFRQTIETINAADYNTEQVKAWSAGALKKKKWLQKINEQYFLVAEQHEDIIGFASITGKGYLDFLFVGKDHQRKNIASDLCTQLELYAARKAISSISSDVSITARPFFEKRGFYLIKKQEVQIDGVALTNYKMEKSLILAQPFKGIPV